MRPYVRGRSRVAAVSVQPSERCREAGVQNRHHFPPQGVPLLIPGGIAGQEINAATTRMCLEALERFMPTLAALLPPSGRLIVGGILRDEEGILILTSTGD